MFSIAITAWSAKACEQRDLLVGEWPHLSAPQRDRTDAIALPHRARKGWYGRHQRRAFALLFRIRRLGLDIEDVDKSARPERFGPRLSGTGSATNRLDRDGPGGRYEQAECSPDGQMSPSSASHSAQPIRSAYRAPPADRRSIG